MCVGGGRGVYGDKLRMCGGRGGRGSRYILGIMGEYMCMCIYQGECTISVQLSATDIVTQLFEIQFSTLYMFSNGVVRFWANSIIYV